MIFPVVNIIFYDICFKKTTFSLKFTEILWLQVTKILRICRKNFWSLTFLRNIGKYFESVC